jgi:hypothetical protein
MLFSLRCAKQSATWYRWGGWARGRGIAAVRRTCRTWRLSMLLLCNVRRGLSGWLSFAEAPAHKLSFCTTTRTPPALALRDGLRHVAVRFIV